MQIKCPMGARVVVVGGLRWWRGTLVVVVRCVLLAETAVGRPKNINTGKLRRSTGA